MAAFFRDLKYYHEKLREKFQLTEEDIVRKGNINPHLVIPFLTKTYQPILIPHSTAKLCAMMPNNFRVLDIFLDWINKTFSCFSIYLMLHMSDVPGLNEYI